MAALSRLLLAAIAAGALAGCATAPAEPAAVAGERGLWVGPIQLCRDTVEETTTVADIAGSPAVAFTLKPAFRARLARETGRLVGRKLPIRLDGRTISEPIVYEPILGGRAQISGLPEVNERIEQPC